MVRSSLVLLRGADAGCENFDQRLRLSDERIDLRWRKEWDTMDQPQPAARFANLFQADAEFVDEILPRFRTLQLTVIRQWRSTTPQ
jgi:hypothetical protein